MAMLEIEFGERDFPENVQYRRNVVGNSEHCYHCVSGIYLQLTATYCTECTACVLRRA